MKTNKNLTLILKNEFKHDWGWLRHLLISIHAYII